MVYEWIIYAALISIKLIHFFISLISSILMFLCFILSSCCPFSFLSQMNGGWIDAEIHPQQSFNLFCFSFFNSIPPLNEKLAWRKNKLGIVCFSFAGGIKERIKPALINSFNEMAAVNLLFLSLGFAGIWTDAEVQIRPPRSNLTQPDEV